MEEQDKLTGIFDFSFTAKLKDDLRTAAIWAKLAAIFSFIGSAVALVESMRLGNIFSAFISAAISVTIAIYLFNFGSKTKKAIEATDQPELEEGLNSLRLYFKILGIILIIVLSIVVIVLFFAIMVAATR